MLSTHHRFHGHSSLGYLHAKGRTVRGQGVSLRFVPNNRRDVYRAAVIVSKKVSKSAVVRNRIRRRVYEYIRLRKPAIGQLDIAVLVYDAALATMPAVQLRSLLDRVFGKLASSPAEKSHAKLEKKK